MGEPKNSPSIKKDKKMSKLAFMTDGLLRTDSEFGEQVHEDFPSKKAIDALTDGQMKSIWTHAPVGYFKATSSLSAYFQEVMEERGLFTPAFEREVDKVYRPKLKDYAKKNPEELGLKEHLMIMDIL
jgi:hypothetical protein